MLTYTLYKYNFAVSIENIFLGGIPSKIHANRRKRDVNVGTLGLFINPMCLLYIVYIFLFIISLY